MKELKLKKFKIINLIALVLLIAILSVVPTLVVIKEKNKTIEENFSGTLSTFNGVLNVWHIDTFEGGTNSKQSFLESVARDFEKKYKSTYVHISAYSVEGLSIALSEGKRPDMFSFGSGVGSLLSEYLLKLDCEENILDDYKKSGIFNDKQLALPIFMGGYALFSTAENLANAGKDINSNLIEIAFSSGYQKQLRKSTKEIPSISFGNDGFLVPQTALYLHTKTSIDTPAIGSTYDAYVGFVGCESSTILLGTQRDLARLSNKLRHSQLTNLIFYPLGLYTDIVQYIGVYNQLDSIRESICKEFASFCLSEKQQQKVGDIGMFSITPLVLYSETEYYGQFENALKMCKNIPSAFRDDNARQSEIENYKS